MTYTHYIVSPDRKSATAKSQMSEPTELMSPYAMEYENHIRNLPKIVLSPELSEVVKEGQSIEVGRDIRLQWQQKELDSDKWLDISERQYSFIALDIYSRRIIAIPVDTGSGELPAGNQIFAIYKQMPDNPLKKFLAQWFDKYDLASTSASPSPVEGGVEELAKEYAEKNGKICEVRGYPVFGYEAIYKAFIAGHASHTLHRSDAVEFAEWIRTARWIPDNSNWWKKIDGEIVDKSTAELYQLFLNNKK